MLARKPEKRRVGRANILLLHEQHVHAGVNEESAEDVHHPRKSLDQLGTRIDHHPAHHQRAQNPPLQHSMLKSFVDRERPEDDEKQEQVVNAEGFFDQVAGKKLNSTLWAREMPDAGSKKNR